ncbi:MAG: phosphate acyltransferase PlsX [Gammaproteobacteria bacterium]|nr:phosphate acyltransferase PlsX [Gammaproteobacteria bacterium]MDH3412841.1 phosphate acyltransferase PlsX [Gammaproteobacteria bacterium]
MRFKIALDAMGGDHGPPVVVPASLKAVSENESVSLILVGDRDVIERERSRYGASDHPRVTLHHASQRVEMDDLPSLALRSKKDSSMRVAVDLVKNGDADACVSAGNTGALMATARFVLKTLPGIDRPAIISSLPSIKGHTHVLDLGANAETSPEQLFQFAVMGSVLVSAVDNVPRPSVGLLNIGAEEIKGNESVKEAARLLASSDLHYIGFVEGDDIYKGTADVVVCDGFVGNVALKSSEGVALMIGHFARQEFTRSIFTKTAGLICMPVLRSLHKRFDPRQYNGASFVGLNGIVIKSHGSADVVAFSRAITEAAAEIRKNVPNRIRERLESLLSDKEVV